MHLKWPFYGSRRMVFELNQAGHGINRKRVQRLMRVMGIEALVPRPGTSKAAPGHKIYPYLLRGVSITEPNHVWASDITYIPMALGFLYLVAIIDWASRAVLAWRCRIRWIRAFVSWRSTERGAARHAENIRHRSGEQFTSSAFTSRLEAAGIVISMDDAVVSWRKISSNGCGVRSIRGSASKAYTARRERETASDHG